MKTYDKLAIIISILFITCCLLSVRAYRVKQDYNEAVYAAETSPELNGPTTIRLVLHGQTYCSGAVITDTVLVTAGHCVAGALMGRMLGFKTEIRRRDNQPTNIWVEAGGMSQQMDTGTMTGNFSKLFHMPVYTNPYTLYDAVQSAPYLISCGYPMGGDLYCKRLTFQGFRDFNWLVYGQLIPGMSGGPVMLPDGTIVAVNSSVDGANSRVAPLINIPLEARK